MQNSRRRLAIVTPIFSGRVSGGSERLIYLYTLMLSKFYEVTVLSTRSLDYISWKNQIPVKEITPVQLGPDIEKRISSEWLETNSEDRIRILRFSVEKERQIQKFNKYSDRILNDRSYGPFSKNAFKSEEDRERIWVEMQGPYCPDLIQYIETNERDYDVFVFVSYLYYPMVYGLPLVAKKSLVIPTLHDEPPARLSIYRNLFKDDSAYSFNTPEERTLFQNIYGFSPSLENVIGMHLETPEPEMLERKPLKKETDFFDFLYVGRIDEGKGVSELVDFFADWQRRTGRQDKLLLAGKGDLKLLHKLTKHPFLQVLGFVEESEKARRILEADVLINPSPMESFSIILMEAWIRGTAVLVNGKSEVLKGHCLRSNGGLYYIDKQSFAAVADYLVSHPKEREIMGINGKRYVQSNFNPNIVEKKLINIVERTIRRRYSE
ncbi:glycosyltransferase, group 1 family protein [Leptospira fainei serovar Hurstbridge str. BUT 6]|uniref:Glycosyltransferase, group 1 family protein n=1 Tax=Leptospira fainei serovar Hurstbridge str. BUT 6 TaxID=1193011 RepID=S3UXF5_9LEPT|nr:glycosyltransferase family 4 protein [Leptospira fainei]EPG73943.1 glycosyltransferase, group 1 family protein [Leptospira fainei serovar Hurstbridge str. BUT 6]